MATSGQIEFIADLLEAAGLTALQAAELADNPDWERYEFLLPSDASEMIDWLKDYKHERYS